MSNIGFTHKTEPIYDRFQAMRRAYEDKHGRTYAPDFLAVLMDAWKQQELSMALSDGWNSRKKGMGLLDLLYATKDLDGLTPDEIAALDEAIEECKPVSLHDYAANAEANDPQYLEPENETE